MQPVDTTLPTYGPDSIQLQKVLPLISGKWRLLIIQSLQNSPVRYGTLRRMHPRISEKVLLAELKDLIQLGAVQRTAFSCVPPRVEYSLTDKGQLLLPVIEHLRQVSQEWLA